MDLYRFLLFGGMFFAVSAAQAEESPLSQFVDEISVITPNERPRTFTGRLTIKRPSQEPSAQNGLGLRPAPWFELNLSADRREKDTRLEMSFGDDLLGLRIWRRGEPLMERRIIVDYQFSSRLSIGIGTGTMFGYGSRFQYVIEDRTGRKEQILGGLFLNKRTAETQWAIGVLWKKEFK